MLQDMFCNTSKKFRNRKRIALLLPHCGLVTPHVVKQLLHDYNGFINRNYKDYVYRKMLVQEYLKK